MELKKLSSLSFFRWASSRRQQSLDNEELVKKLVSDEKEVEKVVAEVPVATSSLIAPAAVEVEEQQGINLRQCCVQI